MSNSCDCPNPPGGRVTCNNNQLAICRVKNGVPEMCCVDLPTSIDNINDQAERNAAINAWVYKYVTEQDISRRDAMGSNVVQFLHSGQFINRETGEMIRFRAPR